MNDNIVFRKMWQDGELIEIKAICSAETIIATTSIYVSYSLIDDLIYAISLFLSGSEERFWENEKKGNDTTTSLSFQFLNKDRLGHILIEVFMEIDDGGDYTKHNCCFYVNTETGLLKRFCDRLPYLKQESCDFEVVLNPYSP